MGEMSETERESRLRATRAMLDDLYKRTSESRGEMMRASRRNFTNSPERGMSRDGEAAAADARSLADNLVRGSSSGARATLGVQPASAMGKGPSGTRAERGRQASADARGKRPSPPVAMNMSGAELEAMDRAAMNRSRGNGEIDETEYQARLRAMDRERANREASEANRARGNGEMSEAEYQARLRRGGPSRKSGTDEDINREDQIWREGVQGAENRRREYMNDIDERYDSGLFSEEGYRRALEAMERGGNRDQVRSDLKERHQAGLLTDAEYMRAAEALENAP